MGTATRHTRSQQNAANRAAVLTAAEQVFGESGYGAATLDRIAEAAGFTKGAVYSRFGGKADLFVAVVEQRIEARALENLDRIDAAHAAGTDPLDALVTTMHDRARTEAGWRVALLEFRLVAARDADLRERYRALHGRTVLGVVNVLDRLAEWRAVPLGLPTDVLARTILALDAGTLLEDLTDDPLPVAARVDVLRRLLTPLDPSTTTGEP